MSDSASHIAFTLDGQVYAVPLDRVDRVLRAVEVTVLPEAAGAVAGVIDIRGSVVHVVDLRRLFGLTVREVDIEDQFIVVSRGAAAIALHVDDTLGIVNHATSTDFDAETLAPHLRYVAGLMTTADGFIVVLDLDQMVDPADLEQLALDAAQGEDR